MNEFRIRLRMRHPLIKGDYRHVAITDFNRRIITTLDQYTSIDPKDKDLYDLSWGGYYLEEFLERIE